MKNHSKSFSLKTIIEYQNQASTLTNLANLVSIELIPVRSSVFRLNSAHYFSFKNGTIKLFKMSTTHNAIGVHTIESNTGFNCT